MPKRGTWPQYPPAIEGGAAPPFSNGRHYPAPQPQPDLTMGLTFGQLLAGQERQIFVSELIAERLDQLPGKIAAQLPQPAPTPQHAPASPPPEKLNTWQIAQLVMAAIVVLSAVVTKTPLKDVIPSLMKSIG